MVELQLFDASKIDTEPSLFLLLTGVWFPLCLCRVSLCFMCPNTVLLVALSDNTFPIV